MAVLKLNGSAPAPSDQHPTRHTRWYADERGYASRFSNSYISEVFQPATDEQLHFHRPLAALTCPLWAQDVSTRRAEIIPVGASPNAGVGDALSNAPSAASKTHALPAATGAALTSGARTVHARCRCRGSQVSRGLLARLVRSYLVPSAASRAKTQATTSSWRRVLRARLYVVVVALASRSPIRMNRTCR
jgi:hypothetical protein